jgi:type IV pilus assembly protein PilV
MERAVITNNKGVSLIEVMIALVILLVTSLALMQTALLGISMNVQNAMRDEAVNVAEMEMNDLRNLPFDSIDTAATSTVASRNLRGFIVNYAISPQVANINSNSKQINISVAWSYRGKAYTHGITTILRKP